MACGRDTPGEVLEALLGETDDVPTDRLAALVGALGGLADEGPELDAALLERLLSLAEEDAPKTVPHGVHRRLRVSGLRQRLRDLALSDEQRARLLALPGDLSRRPAQVAVLLGDPWQLGHCALRIPAFERRRAACRRRSRAAGDLSRAWAAPSSGVRR